MNKIFKTKYDVTTGQCQAVSELANNRQVASSSEKAKCGGLFGGILGEFKVLPLALVMSGIFGVNNLSFAADYIEVDSTKVGPSNYYIQQQLGTDSVHLYGWNYKKSDGRYKNFTGTVLIGAGASIGASGSTVIGYKANAQSDSTVSIGKEAQSSGSQSVALGNKANAKGEQSLALGADSNATGYASIALGGDDLGSDASTYKYARPLSKEVWQLYRSNLRDFHNQESYATTKNTNTTYEQYLSDSGNTYSQNWAKGRGAISIGSRTIAYGDGSTSIGTLSIAKGNYSTAMGAGTLALGDSSIALGNETYVYATKSVGIGNEVQALSDGSMVYGLQSYAGGTGSIAIGTRALSNVKMKTDNTNGVNLATQYTGESKRDKHQITSELEQLDREKEQLYQPVTDKQAGSGEFKAQTNNTGAIAIGYYVIASGENSLALGRQAYAEGERGIAIGPYAYAKGRQSFALGYGAKALKNDTFAIGSYSRVDGENSIALGIEAKVLNDSGDNNLNGENSLALGNNTEVTMKNSVALGYKSTTKYFYSELDTQKSTATLSGKDAIDLPPYIPEGSSYDVATDSTAGVVSVGGWDNSHNSSTAGKSKSAVGLRRIINVAPGALDSDVATVGQLKALEYAKKEGVVVYYTVENGKNIKLVKDPLGKFYKVNTKNGTPLTELGEVPAAQVLVGAKGDKETIQTESKNGQQYELKDIGNAIKFGHLAKGEISATSDQAITGAQLYDLKGKLGLKENAEKTGFDEVLFGSVEYISTPKSVIGKTNTFKAALDETIKAINQGYKFSDGKVHQQPFYLGATIEITAGDSDGFKGKNLKTKFKSENKNSKAIFEIGLKEAPSFKSVTIEDTINEKSNEKLAVNKKYVDDKFKNIATSFNVSSDSGAGFKVTTQLAIKGDSSNITTKANGNEVKISLNESLTGISSIAGKNGNSGNKIDFTNSGGLKLSSKSGSTITLKSEGLDLGNKKITQLAKGTADTDAANFGQLKELATTVLGATVNSSGFTKSTFNQLIGSNGATASTPATAKTFKQAIEDNIAKINEGFIFGAGDQTNEYGTHYLGDKLTIKAGNIDSAKFKSDNIKTHYEKKNKNILIGIKDDPTFKMVSVSEDVTEHSNEKVLTTKKYVDDKVNNLSSNLKFQADSGGDKTLPLKTGTLKVKGTANQIKTSVESNDTIKIGLDDKITNKINETADKAGKNEQAITAVKTSIEGKITDQVIKYKANDTGDKTVKLSEGLNFKNGTNTTAVVESNGVVKFNVNEALKEIASIAGKEVNGGNGGTKVKTEIKFNESRKGNNANTNVVILSNDASYTFDPKGFHVGNKKITALASGLGLTDTSGTGGSAGNNSTVIANVLAGDPDKGNNNGNKISNNAINVKDLSEVAKALVEKGLKFQGNDSQDVTRKLGETLKIVGETATSASGTTATTQITTAPDNIIVAKKNGTNGKADTLEIKLSKNLKGIASIANGEKAKIALGGSNGSDNKITFKAGSSEVTLADGKFSGVSEINKADGKGALKLEDGKATLESTKDGSNVTLDSTSATLSAGQNAGSIKVVNNGGKKIELSPEKDAKVTLAKDTANGNTVKATGLSTVGLDGSNALVFKNGTSGTAELKVGGNSLTFTKSDSGNTVKISNVADGKIDTSSTEAITGKQLHALGATHLGLELEDSDKTKFKELKFDTIKGGTSGTANSNGPTTFKDAINQLITAVNGGLTFKGNDTSSSKTTLQLGETLTIDSSPVSSTAGTNGAVEKDITVTLTPSTTGDAKEAGTLTLKLNKANTVSENDEKVVTSKAVAEKLKEYTSTATLGKDFLKVDGSNINGKQDEFGKNVGIDNINLSSDKESTKLVQAKALINYLKGTGTGSVKISDNPETKAEGEGSIAVGDKAIAQNVGAVAIGQNSGAKNNGAISIGKGSDVTEKDGIAIGTGTKVSGQSSVALGESNKVSGVQSYVIGSDNDIKGRDVVAIGSKIIADDKISDAVILGNRSTGEANTVSVGSKDTKRRIIFVDTPTGEYDAANKKYVDELKITYKANGNGATDKKQTVKLTDGLNFKKGENDNIQVKVDANGSIQHNLANQLKDINSIWGGKDEMGAKITLEKDKKEISFNNSKLKDLLDGEIGDSSKEAITGKQLADLANKLGIEVDTSKTTFKAPTFDDFKLKGINGNDGTAPKNIVEGLKNAVSKLNEGLKFNADLPASTNGTQNTPHYLGSTINIVRLVSNTAGVSSQPNIAEFKGDNLITRYTNESGNAKIEIGFKNAPMFEKVTLSKEQTYDGGRGNSGSTDWKNELITKGYLEQALDKFKFKVSTGDGGDKTFEIGRGDTLKFTSGQNIKVDLAKNGTTPSSTGSTSPSASASAPAPTPAAPAPSPAPAATPSPTTTSTMSSASSTTTATTTPTTGTTTAPTTAVVTIATKDELENIKSISSPKGSAGGNGAGSTGEVTKLTLDADKGATFKVGNQGAEVNINKDGITLTPQGANSATHPSARVPSITIKASSNSKDLVGSDNGSSIEFLTKGSNGSKTGTGKITGLADIKEGEKDGTIAVNKNYVDKLDKVTVKYDDEHKKSITLGGKPQNGGKAHDPVAINNLKSGLGLDDMKDKPDYQKNGLSLELVKKLVSNGISSQQGQQMTEQQDLHQAANLADLKAVAQAGLRFKGNQGDDVVRKISDTLTIKGEEETQNGQATSSFSSAAGNIKVETNTAKDGLEIKLSDTLKNMKAFETKEEGGKKATLNSDGLTVVNKGKDGNSKGTSATYGADNIMLEDKKTGNKATITAESFTFADNVAQNQQNPMPKAVLNKNGLAVNGKGGEIKIDGENGVITVPDIKPTTSESAVVNKKYVDGQLSAAVNRLDNVISANNKRLQSGIAGANAAAALPTIAMPGKSALAVSAGTYRGQSAVALGYSRVSDNGKIMLKLHGNSTSTGDFGGGVGIGWAW